MNSLKTICRTIYLIKHKRSGSHYLCEITLLKSKGFTFFHQVLSSLNFFLPHPLYPTGGEGFPHFVWSLICVKRYILSQSIKCYREFASVCCLHLVRLMKNKRHFNMALKLDIIMFYVLFNTSAWAVASPMWAGCQQ